MTRQSFRQYLIGLFTDSIGVAAEFVVDDAFDLIDQHPEWRAHPQLLRAQFLLILEKVAPPELPLAKLRSEIAAKLSVADLT